MRITTNTDIANFGSIGQADGGFVIPKSELDSLIARTNGDKKLIKKAVDDFHLREPEADWGAVGRQDVLLSTGRRALGDLPLNSSSLDALYAAGKLSMDEARALAKNAGWKDAEGKWIYPPNNGFDGVVSKVTLKPPTEIDRYGGRIDLRSGEFIDTGQFTSPAGVSYGSRALPAGAENGLYRRYEVLKPIPAEAGKAAPWFDEVGGGTQMKSEMTIEQLINGNFIRELR